MLEECNGKWHLKGSGRPCRQDFTLFKRCQEVAAFLAACVYELKHRFSDRRTCWSDLEEVGVDKDKVMRVCLG